MLRARKLVGATLTAGLIMMGGIGTTVASAGAAHAATCTASQYTADLDKIIKRADNLSARLQSLSTSSSSAAVQAEAKSTVKDLSDLVTEFNAATFAVDGCGPLSGPDAAIVTARLDNLTAVFQATLATLIGKHSIFAQFNETAPIAAVLRALEASVDSYSFALINVAPDEVPAITSDQSALDTAVGNTISTYSQICIPSPLYPIILPVCVSS
jgi:hypothetical protein